MIESLGGGRPKRVTDSLPPNITTSELEDIAIIIIIRTSCHHVDRTGLVLRCFLKSNAPIKER